MLEKLDTETNKNKILSQQLEDKQSAVSKAEKSIKEKQERILELEGHRSDLTKEIESLEKKLESLEKKLKEAEEVISFCKEAEVNKLREDLETGEKIEPEIEDQIIHIVKELEMKSQGAYTLEKFKEDIQRQKDFQIEKKLTVGKALGKVAMKIEKCQNCKNNLMKFLDKQRINVDNIVN